MGKNWKPRKRDVISVEKCKLNSGSTAYRIRWQLLPGHTWNCDWANSHLHKDYVVRKRYREILDARKPVGIASVKTIFGTPPND